jgi:hypothetical protein
MLFNLVLSVCLIASNGEPACGDLTIATPLLKKEHCEKMAVDITKAWAPLLKDPKATFVGAAKCVPAGDPV